MFKAERKHKSLVISILSDSFEENLSVNYIVKDDAHRKVRIRALMEYSFEVCYMAGAVFLSDDMKGCALVLFPDKKKMSLKSIFLDLQLLYEAIGLSRVQLAMKRESAIKSNYPAHPIYYLWFLGVFKSDQGNGIGSRLLAEIIQDSIKEERDIYLETSTNKNIPWYMGFGFAIYNELDFGYKLYMLRREEGSEFLV